MSYFQYLYQKLSIDNAYNLLKYKIITNKNNLSNYLTVDEGIENRIIKYINKSNTWNELVMNIKTKRYTYNKINRMLILFAKMTTFLNSRCSFWGINKKRLFVLQSR